MDRALFQQSTTLQQLHHVVGRGLDDLPHVVVKGFIKRVGQVIEPVLLFGNVFARTLGLVLATLDDPGQRVVVGGAKPQPLALADQVQWRKRP